MYGNCILCPRECRVARNFGKYGFCGVCDKPIVARAALHMWEEPCISGSNGSGTIFFAGCTLKCIYCQNHDIAIGKHGKEITSERLAEIMRELQSKKANNINLVTPTHFVPSIIEAVNMAKQRGLRIPIVYNTSGYEKVDTLKMLEGIVDCYLPDFKYYSAEIGKKYSNVPDYFERASEAVAEMVRQVGEPEFFAEEDKPDGTETGMIKRGVIVRHLLLPGYLEDSKKVVRYLYETYGDKIYISLMNQYTPLAQVKDTEPLNRKVTEEEYDELVDYAIELGVEKGFIQEGDTAEESFIPAFDCEGV